MIKAIVINLLILITFLSCYADLGYGPFNMVIRSFEVCSAPKPKNCALLKVNITGDTTILLNFRVLKNCAPTKGKILTLSGGKVLTRFHMNKPCEHVFLRPLLETIHNLTKRCEVVKGDYLKEIDIGQIGRNYFAGSFFYGNITFISHLYNDECNFSCAILKISFTPKK